jgi:hypothetical protein
MKLQSVGYAVRSITANLLLPIYYFANPAGGVGIDETTRNHHAHDARGHVYARSMCDFDDYWGDLAGLCGAKTRQM